MNASKKLAKKNSTIQKKEKKRAEDIYEWCSNELKDKTAAIRMYIEDEIHKSIIIWRDEKEEKR